MRSTACFVVMERRGDGLLNRGVRAFPTLEEAEAHVTSLGQREGVTYDIEPGTHMESDEEEPSTPPT